MKIVFEMNDDTFKDIDFLLLSQDSTKAYYFDEIMENCVPLSKVLDKIRSEIEQFAKNPNFGDLSLGASCGAMKALEIIDKCTVERRNKE